MEILDYGLTLEEESFIISPNGCRLQWPLAAAYALAMVTQAGASKINLVGFDGYSADDPRQEEMNDVFFKYIKDRHPRMGFIVSKKYGNAVERNLFKRRARNIIRDIEMSFLFKPHHN